MRPSEVGCLFAFLCAGLVFFASLIYLANVMRGIV